MRILITGGAGFIGSHTARLLVQAGHSVRILDILDQQVHGPRAAFPAWLPPEAETLRGDICNPEDLDRALDGVDAVIHSAALTGVGQSMYDLSAYARTNVAGTALLLERILKRKQSLKRMVLSSSRAIYGEGLHHCMQHGVFHPEPRERSALAAGRFEIACPLCGAPAEAAATPESFGARPLSMYAWTKFEQEAYLRFAAKAHGLPITILRYFNVYGARQSLRNPYTGIVSIFFSRLKSGAPISLYEGGQPLRDFVHVLDVARANVLALSPELPPCACLNVGSGHAITVKQLALALAHASGRTARLEDRGEYRVGDVRACFAEGAQARQVLGFTPNVSLEVGLRDFAAWAAEMQQSDDRYEQTVAELRNHGLFGVAERQAS